MSLSPSGLEQYFNDKAKLRQALTHKSFANEQKPGLADHNEKLEFLGDAVLDLVIGEYLFENFPQDTEGNLSKKRASVVNEEVLSRLALGLQLDQSLLLGKGEIQTGGARKPRLLASAFEAVVGALFLDRDFGAVRDFVRECFREEIRELSAQVDFEKDYKTRLQEVIQKVLKEAPEYVLLAEEGPAHERLFRVAVQTRKGSLAEGVGKTKKAAEQQAAAEALKALQNEKEKA